MVRRFDFSDQAKQPETPSGSRVRPLNIGPSLPTPAPEPKKKPAALNIQYSDPVKNRVRTVTDDLIDKARSIDPSIDAFRLRARIDTLLRMDLKGFLDWGDRNLTPLRVASDIQSKIASRMAQINALGWINETMEVSSKKPSLMAEIFGNLKSPAYYEAMLQKARAEMMQLVDEVTTIYKNYEPTIRELQLDGVGLQVVAETVSSNDQQIAMNRARTLVNAYQTAVMLLQLIDNTKMTCAQHIQKIDDLMSVTIPNWKMAHGKS